MSNTDGLLRARFHELRAEIDAIEKAAAPVRAKRDALMGKHEKEAAAANDAVRAAEAGLFEKKNDLARLSRALGGNTALEG